MRTLAELEFLNGLKVEREILEEEGEYLDEDEDGNSIRKSRSPVKEEPSEEDMEDEEYQKKSQQNSEKKDGVNNRG